MKRILIGITLLLIVALALTACGKSNKKPETVYDILADAFDKTANAGTDESASVWEQALNGGSIEAIFNYGEDIIPIKTISGKYYLDLSKNTSASILSLGLTTGETFDLSMFSDAEKAVLLSSAITGAYGFTPESYSEFFTKMLTPEEGSAASLSAAMTEKLTKLLADNSEAIAEGLEKHFPLTMTNAESSITFAFTVSNTSVKAFLNDMIVLFENNADFKGIVKEIMAASGESVTDADLNEGFAEMKTELSALDETPFNATVSLTATKERIITGASIVVYENKDAVGTPLAKVLLSLPENGGFNLDATIEDQTITASYTVTKYGTVSKEVLSIGAMGVNLTPLTLTYDSANGDYELKVEIAGTFSAVATGNYSATKTEAALTLSSIKVTIPNGYDDMFDSSDSIVIDLPITMTITAKAKDTAPKAPTQYTDIATLSEAQLEEIVETLMDDPAIATFIEMVGGLGGNAEEIRPIA